MKTITFNKQSAASKIAILKPLIGEQITLNLNDSSFSVGTLASVDMQKVKVSCDEGGDEFYIRLSKIDSVSIRSRGNWKSIKRNASSSKTERLQVRCTLAQRKAIEKAASASNLNISDFVIKSVLDIANATNLWSG